MSDLISRETAIQTVHETMYQFIDDSETMTDRDGLLLKVNKAICNGLKEIPSAEIKGKWIPVSERLPEEENKRYWICTDCGYQYECRWTNVNHFWTYLTTDWHWHIMDVPQYSKVIAWMPLPEPYKKGGE